MVAYVRLVPRIGEHRRENLFLGGSSLKKQVFFIFARNYLQGARRDPLAALSVPAGALRTRLAGGRRKGRRAQGKPRG